MKCKRCDAVFLGDGDYCQACMRLVGLNPKLLEVEEREKSPRRRSKIEQSPNLQDYIVSRMMGASFRDLEKLAQSYNESISNDSFRLYFEENPVPVEEPVIEIPKSPKPETEVYGKLSFAHSKRLDLKVIESGIISEERLHKLLKGR